MPYIRRAYKRDYNIELVDDLLQSCGETATLLAQIAAKGANPPTGNARKGAQAKVLNNAVNIQKK